LPISRSALDLAGTTSRSAHWREFGGLRASRFVFAAGIRDQREDDRCAIVLGWSESRRHTNLDARGAELAASEQIAMWFRKIEPLNVIGNLGPLVGLAGHRLGDDPSLLLPWARPAARPARRVFRWASARPCSHVAGPLPGDPSLLVFGFYRSTIDRHCTRAMVIASELVEKLPAEDPEPAPVR